MFKLYGADVDSIYFELHGKYEMKKYERLLGSLGCTKTILASTEQK